MHFKEWLLITESKEEKALALELAGDALQELNSVIPQNQKDSDPLLLLAAYFYNKQKNLTQIKKDIQDYIALVKNNKMPLIKVNLQNKSPDKPFDDYLHWTQVIHGHQAEESYKQAKKFKPSDIDFQNEKPIETSPDGKIKVYRANSPQQCIILGKGQTFCISQPGNTMWKSYRDTKGSTFYFVYDDSREDELGIVVVDATEHGIQLTDKKNTTGTTLDPFTVKRTTDSSSYLKYLKQKGIDTSVFVNLPKTKEEIAEDEKLGQINDDLNWFIGLNPQEKSNYIGRGHNLTDEQFDYLWNNKFSSLLEQYVKTGLRLSDYQIDKVGSNSDLRKNYIHNRIIAQNVAQNGPIIYGSDSYINEKEFKYLSKEQINELSDKSFGYLLNKTKDRDAMAKFIIENKKDLDELAVLLIDYATKKDEIAKLIIKSAKDLSVPTVQQLFFHVENVDEVAKTLDAKIIKKLDYNIVGRLINKAMNKEKMAELLGSENINKLPPNSVSTMLAYAKDKDEMAKILGLENINKLPDDQVHYLLYDAPKGRHETERKNRDENKRILKQYGRI